MSVRFNSDERSQNLSLGFLFEDVDDNHEEREQRAFEEGCGPESLGTTLDSVLSEDEGSWPALSKICNTEGESSQDRCGSQGLYSLMLPLVYEVGEISSQSCGSNLVVTCAGR